MKKLVVLSAAAVMALAGSALAQPAAQIQLRFVPQNGGFGTGANALTTNALGSAPAQTVNGPVNFTTAFRTIRLRVDYRVIDTNLTDGITTAGLVAGQLNITAATVGNITSANTTVGPSVISVRENSQTAIPNPTTTRSGFSANDWHGNDVSAATGSGGTSGPLRTGLAGTFRGGFSNPDNNAESSNGTVSGLNINGIVPTAISQHHQDQAGYDDGSGNPAFDDGSGSNPIGLGGNEWYTLYILTVVAQNSAGGTGASLTLTAAFQPDAGTGNSFAYFIVGSNVPVNSPNSASASITINIPAVPAPGAMALLGMGGLIAARRRRA